MKLSARSPEEEISPAVRETAARWRVRRDQGLTDAEEEEFFAWLDANKCHAMACGDLEATIETLSALQSFPTVAPAVSPPPAARRRGLRFWVVAAAAAAALGFGLFQLRPDPADVSSAPAVASVRTYDLPDGSVIETNVGARVAFAYTATERRVHLVSGEAHFTVAKHQPRPFVVDANGLIVRAVGTAFDVRLQTQDVRVLVTEGRVEVSAPRDAAVMPALSRALPDHLFLDSGHRVTLPFEVLGTPAAPDIQSVSAHVIDEALAWRSHALVFNDAKLAEVVAVFNLHNAHQLVIDDAELADQRFGGTFRPDAYEAVVRLLVADFGVTAREEPGRTILRRSR